MESPLPNRQSIRLKNYHYSKPGYYFVTICCEHHQCLFGHIHDHNMQLNIAGQMIQTTYTQLPTQHPNIKLHNHIIMPNHFHAIIQITHQTQIKLGNIVQTFKRISTLDYIKLVKQNKLPRFNKRIWQRNYWEHIIRNQTEYNHISQYIQNNPKTWQEDKLNPKK